MQTRGAPLIGAVGAYGLALAVRDDASDEHIQKMVEMLAETRPTAINLKWALWRMRGALLQSSARQARRPRLEGSRADRRRGRGDERSDRKERPQPSSAIWRPEKPGKTVNILTHCNAGWLATVDYGTALAPIYLAHDEGIPIACLGRRNAARAARARR